MPLIYTKQPDSFGLSSKVMFYNPLVILKLVTMFPEDTLNLDKALEMSEINRKFILFVFYMILLFIPSRIKLLFCL